MTPSRRPVFFIDWCLGKTVADALEAVNVQIERHGDHFQQSTPDTEWLSVAGDRDWVVLTKDKAIGKNILELRAIAKAHVKVFALASGNLTRQDMANLFVQAISKLEKFSQGNKPPFIAKIYKNGTVKVWRNRTELLKFLKGSTI